MKKICGLIKNCLYKCFRDEQDQYRNRVIQLQQRMLKKQKSEKAEDNIFHKRDTQSDYISSIQSPKKQMVQSPPKNQSQEVKQQNNDQKNRKSNGSIDSYYTINSMSTTNQGISRRKFKKSNSLKKSLMASVDLGMSKNNQFKQIVPQHMNQSQLNLSRVQSKYNSIQDALYQWNQSQYQRISTFVNFQLSSTQLMKLSSNTYINQAINKLEDFYTFYFNQLNSQFVKTGKQQQQIMGSYNGHTFRKFPQFKCSYNSEHDNINASQNFMVLMTFQANTSNSLQFLKWYNSVNVQSKLHNFQKIKLVDNNQYPIFQIEQFGIDLKQKHTYLTFRQTQAIRFQNQPDTQYIVQLNSTFRKGKNYKSLIKFSDSDNGLVEIYYESQEKILTKPEDFYTKKFQTLQKLIKQRFLMSINRQIK